MAFWELLCFPLVKIVYVHETLMLIILARDITWHLKRCESCLVEVVSTLNRLRVWLASHAVVFRGLVLPPPHGWGGGNTSPLKTTAWEARVWRERVENIAGAAGATIKAVSSS